MLKVDLRSDTFTMPDDGMRRAIYEAEVGNSGYAEDPSVKVSNSQAVRDFICKRMPLNRKLRWYIRSQDRPGLQACTNTNEALVAAVFRKCWVCGACEQGG